MYVQIVNNQPIQYSLQKLRADNRRTSFPKNPTEALLSQFNVHRVITTDPPLFDPLYQQRTYTIEQIGGEWKQVWAVSNITITRSMVIDESNRRLQDIVVWNGNQFKLNQNIEYINSILALALSKKNKNPQPAGRKWVSNEFDFTFETADSRDIPMDIDEAIDFCEAVIRYVISVKKTAQDLVKLPTIPENYASDTNWPDKNL